MQFPNHVTSPAELREYAAAIVTGRVLAALAEQLEQATDDPEPTTAGCLMNVLFSALGCFGPPTLVGIVPIITRAIDTTLPRHRFRAAIARAVASQIATGRCGLSGRLAQRPYTVQEAAQLTALVYQACGQRRPEPLEQLIQQRGVRWPVAGWIHVNNEDVVAAAQAAPDVDTHEES